MKKSLKFVVDLLIIVASFEVSEKVAERVVKNGVWWVELLVYMAVYMSLQGAVWLIKRAIDRRDA